MKTKLACLILLISIYTGISAQTIQEQMTRQQPNCQDVLINAGEVLPKLYAQKSFDSISAAIDIINNFCGTYLYQDESFYLKVLLSIQQSSFTVADSSFNYPFYYSILNNRIAYGPYLSSPYYVGRYNNSFNNFYFSKDRLNTLIRVWAKDLLTNPRLSSNEFFICNAIAGNYKNPKEVLKAEKEKYPDLYALLRQKEESVRNESAGVFNLMIGAWVPRGNLKVLGSHPSFGFQFGGRDKRNELLFTVQIRAMKAANFYTVKRSDSLYRLNKFTGYYLGLDYLRYFYHSLHFEAGLVGGVGYDGFDISSSNNDDEDYLKPFAIGSINTNAGFRFNYYPNPHYSIGIMAKYNAIWYKNTGGTNLTGHPFSIDLVFGR